MAAGDVLFYKYKQGLFELAIAEWCHSQYVHVEVDVGGGYAIGAHKEGIVRHPLVKADTVWVFSDHVKDVDQLQHGLDWLQRQVGKEYGVNDLVVAVLDRFYRNFYFGLKDHYDCSDLAARFLMEAGAVNLLGDLAQALNTVTPALLAKQLGVQQGLVVKELL